MADKNLISKEELVDKKLTCRDCGNLFLFTKQEQLQYLEKGLNHEPSRCADCRRKNRQTIQATMVPVTCRICKQRGFVPEVPQNAIDTLCESCFLAVKAKFAPKETDLKPVAEPHS